MPPAFAYQRARRRKCVARTLRLPAATRARRRRVLREREDETACSEHRRATQAHEHPDALEPRARLAPGRSHPLLEMPQCTVLELADGLRAASEDLGHLACLHSDYVAQRERLALGCREALDQRHELGVREPAEGVVRQ